MNQYPPLIAHGCFSLREVCALRTQSASISYEVLGERCATLRKQWQTSPARRVGLWVNNQLDTLIGIHALNASGRSVALLRGAPSGNNDEYVQTSGCDHIIDCNEWTLKPVDAVQTLNQSSREWSSWGWDEPLFYVQSSGTTNQAKWIALTTRQVHLSAFASSIRIGHLPGDQWLNPLAPGYMGWLAALTRCALYGTTMGVYDYSPETIQTALNSHRYTQVSLVPSMLSQLIESCPNELSDLRTILVGGGPTVERTLRRAHAQGLSVVTTWGMTETASQVATQRSGFSKTVDHVGPPLPFVDVTVQDDRFMLSGPLLNEPLHTRDMGFLDESGQVHVRGRVDDVILSSGHKVLPAEVEDLLADFAGINSVCVFGLPDETWGQLLCAVLVLEDSHLRPDWMDSLSALIDTLPARFKPRRIWQIDRIPVNDMDKPLRTLLSRVCLELNEVMGSKLVQNVSRQSNGLEGLQVDGGMGQSDTGPHGASTVHNVVPENQRALTHLDNSTFHGQFITLPNGFLEVTLRINEGQTHRMCVKELIPVAEDRKENFFEGDMRVFEDSTEKNDASTVNLVESGSKVVTKSHDVNLLRRKGKAKL